MKTETKKEKLLFVVMVIVLHPFFLIVWFALALHYFCPINNEQGYEFVGTVQQEMYFQHFYGDKYVLVVNGCTVRIVGSEIELTRLDNDVNVGSLISIDVAKIMTFQDYITVVPSQLTLVR